MSLPAGSKLGSYEITSRLGSGGMGDVYLARDLELGRKVAIKLLREELAEHPERLKRFEQEARAASALDHPNIVTIYHIGTHGGRRFLAMEYVEGRPLRELIGTRALTLGKSLEIAIQIADGLAKAHGRGIVHRDLKPDNVMVTEDGRVKILDFGLAKLTEPSDGWEASTRDFERPDTEEGHILGTLPYMSPEQAQGDNVDARSDVFSFGSVLYEMVAGRRAFSGSSAVTLLAEIVQREPTRLRELVPSMPLDLDKLISRALRKEPRRRFHSMDDVRVELEEIKEELESGDFVSGAHLQKGPSRVRRWRSFAAGLLAAVVAIAVWRYASRPEAEEPPVTRRLTSHSAPERDPAISPDGTRVAFTRPDTRGVRHLYVKVIDGGEPVPIVEGERTIYAPSFSPDGQQIAFVRGVEEGDDELVHGIFTVSAVGGTARPLTTVSGGIRQGLSWSPDGTVLAVSADTPARIVLFSLQTGELVPLTTPPDGYFGDGFPRFSPDGTRVAFMRERAGARIDIYVVPVGGGAPRLVTEATFRGFDWTSDGEGMIAALDAGPGPGLYRVPISGGEPERLSVGEEGFSPTLSRDGARLVYARGASSSDIWKMGGPAAADGEASPVRFLSATGWDQFPHYSPNGQEIAFSSTRSGTYEIWVCDRDGNNPRRLTFLEAPQTVDGNWSPDGRQLAFTSLKEGDYDIYVVNAAGGVPRRLTTETSDEVGARWSRDGRFIYFSSDRSGRVEVYRMPSEGGDAVQLTTNGGTIALESPDRRFLYFARTLGETSLWRIPIDGGDEVEVITDTGWQLWEMHAEGIFYVNRKTDPPVVAFFDLATEVVTEVAVPDPPPSGLAFAVSPDGGSILYGVREREADLMLVENFR